MIDIWTPGSDDPIENKDTYVVRYLDPETGQAIVNGPFPDMMKAIKSARAAINKLAVSTHIDVLRREDAH